MWVGTHNLERNTLNSRVYDPTESVTVLCVSTLDQV